MPLRTSDNVATAITKLVAVDALPALICNLTVGNLVHRDYEPSINMPGDTVNVPMPVTLTASDIGLSSAGVSCPACGRPDPHQQPLCNAQIPLTTHAEATFQVPDVTKVLAVPDLLKLYMQPAVLALAEHIERDILSHIQQFVRVGNPNNDTDDEVLDYADETLFNARVPASSQKFLVVDANAYRKLRGSPNFREYSSASDAGLRCLVDGPVGRLKEFFVFRSNALPPHAGIFPAFAKEALILVTRRLPNSLSDCGYIDEYAEMSNFGIRVRMAYAPDTLSQTFTIDVLYGSGVLRKNYGVGIRKQ
jgi:hypothetical protein